LLTSTIFPYTTLFRSRKRDGMILHHDYKTLGRLLKDSVEHPVAPEMVDSDKAPVQEVVHKATDKNFDIRKILPAPTNTEYDAGPDRKSTRLNSSHVSI